MRRLAMGAVLGVIAFASPVDSGSSGASTHHPVRRLARPPATVLTASVAEQPSADDDMQAMREATLTAARERATRQRATRSADRSAHRAGAGVWTALAACESHGNPRAVSSSGKYRGAFQFSVASWRSLGYAGDPIDHPFATQLEAAKRLQARSGWGQWPTCARRLGLL